MKKLLAIFSIIVFFTACEEEGPYINFEPEIVDTSLIDTTYISLTSENAQTKNILIEDFTGVNCPNCPKAAQKIHDLQAQYPDRIVAVSIHPEGFAFTEPFSCHYDFRTDDGTNLLSFLGNCTGLPSGGIDRVKFASESRILINFTSWSGHLSERINETTDVNIHLSSSYKADSSDFAKVLVKAHYTENLSDTHYISVFLVESNIVDWQIKPFGIIDSFYTHNHVFRDALTMYNGELLFEQAEKNRVIEKEYKVEIKSEWVAENCSFLVFIHKSGIASKEVIHVEEIEIE